MRDLFRFLAGLIVLLATAAVQSQDWQPEWTLATLSHARWDSVGAAAGGDVFFAGGYAPYACSNVVDIYDTSTGSWSTATLSQARTQLAAAASGNEVVFAGGYTGNPAQIPANTVDIYNTSTRTWSTVTLSQSRAALAAAAADNDVVFAGGALSRGSSNVVDILDTGMNTWSTATLSESRYLLVAAAANGYAAFAGGVSTGTASSAVDIYDGSKRTWSTATLSQPRYYLAAAGAGNYIVFAGGYTGGAYSNVADIYDTSSGSWSRATLSLQRAYLAGAGAGNYIVFAGGAGTSGMSSDVVDIYNTATNIWSTATLSRPRSDMAAAAVGNEVFFAGGVDFSGNPSNVVDILHLPNYTTISSSSAYTLWLGTTVSGRMALSVPGSLNLATFSLNVGSMSGNTSIDLGSGTLTSGSDNTTSTYSGAIRGGGSLIKTGSGALTLSGSESYSGPTSINQGELIVNGSLASPVTVNSGGTLAGMGSLSSVMVNSGGHLAPGDLQTSGNYSPQFALVNPQGVLTLSGSLALLSGAKLDYELDTPPDSDMVFMSSGTLDLNNQQFSDFNFTTLPGFGPGDYTLIDAGWITGPFTSSSGAVDGFPATLWVHGNDLVLTVVPEPGTLALLAGSAIALLGCSRRRLKHTVYSTREPPARSDIRSFRPRRVPWLLNGVLLAAIGSSAAEARTVAPPGTLLASFPFHANNLLADPSQPYIYASILYSGEIAVINTQSLSVQTTIALHGGPQSMALSPDGKSLYVADSTNNSIDVIDTQTLSLKRSLPVATTPYSVAAGMNNRLYVLDTTPVYDHIDQIDALTGASTGPSFGRWLYNGDLETSPDGRTLFYGTDGISPSILYSYDVSTTTITPLSSVETGSNGKKVVVSHNGAEVAQVSGYPYSVTLYSPDGFSPRGTLYTDPYPDAMVFSPDDSLAYVAHSPYPTAVDIFSTASFTRLGQFAIPNQASCMATDLTGQNLFVSFDLFSDNFDTFVYSTGVIVPEPASIALLLAGGLCLMGFTYIRSFSSAAR